MEHALLIIGLTCLFGVLMAWGVGANDLANVMSTAIGSKSITISQALLIALIFEFAGAFLAGGNVMATLRNGIVDPNILAPSPEWLVQGMLAILLAGTSWITLASSFGLPVSITHTIVGAFVGFGLMVAGTHALHWDQVGTIAISWVISPIIAGGIAYALFLSIQKLILANHDPVEQAQRYVPVYIFFVGFILCAITLRHGLTFWNVNLGMPSLLSISMLSGFCIYLYGKFILMPRHLGKMVMSHESRFEHVEKVFSILMFFTACAMVFAHGSNDVANAVAPMAVVISVFKNYGAVNQDTELPLWIIALGCTGVVTGFLMYGRRVVETVGNGITSLTPSRAFSATLAAATTVVFATSTGVPVSATQTLVGAVLGVGLARGIGALNLKVIRNIFMSWLITIPMGAMLTAFYFYCLRFALQG